MSDQGDLFGDPLRPILDAHEVNHAAWLAVLRAHLVTLATSRPDRCADAQDAYRILSMLRYPPDRDRRFLGAVFKDGQWEHVEFIRLRRRHNTLVSRWRLKA